MYHFVCKSIFKAHKSFIISDRNISPSPLLLYICVKSDERKHFWIVNERQGIVDVVRPFFSSYFLSDMRWEYDLTSTIIKFYLLWMIQYFIALFIHNINVLHHKIAKISPFHETTTSLLTLLQLNWLWKISFHFRFSCDESRVESMYLDKKWNWKSRKKIDRISN